MARAAALLAPRPESLELLRFCLEKEIPVWIVSAGLENVIRFWLGQQEIPDEKIRILANRIRYREEKPAGQGPVITAWNKKERFFPAGREGRRTDTWCFWEIRRKICTGERKTRKAFC